ncbi:MAG TPA: N-acetyltransferase [Acholeplasmatales bacterium]|nr:N-acetyltransferase [Acholeplasmatales bacterium]
MKVRKTVKKSNSVSQNISLRKACLDDIEAIMNIEYQCFSQDTIEDAEVYRRRIRTFPDGFWVLEKGGETIGAISSEIWNKTEEISADLFCLGHDIAGKHNPSGNELYISSLGVLPSHRGNGYGEKLFLSLIESVSIAYPNVTSAILLFADDWKAARKIYEKNGFKTVEILPAFFGGRKDPAHDGIVMRNLIHNHRPVR